MALTPSALRTIEANPSARAVYDRAALAYPNYVPKNDLVALAAEHVSAAEVARWRPAMTRADHEGYPTFITRKRRAYGANIVYIHTRTGARTGHFEADPTDPNAVRLPAALVAQWRAHRAHRAQAPAPKTTLAG